MNKNLYKVLCATFVLALSACKDEVYPKAKITSKDLGVVVDIIKAKTFKENDTEKSLVYGTLVFQDLKQPVVKVNLTCIVISVGETKSEGIYVDSVAYILPDNYKVDRDQAEVSVYWKMNHQFNSKLAESDLKVFVKEDCDLLSKQ